MWLGQRERWGGRPRDAGTIAWKPAAPSEMLCPHHRLLRGDVCSLWRRPPLLPRPPHGLHVPAEAPSRHETHPPSTHLPALVWLCLRLTLVTCIPHLSCCLLPVSRARGPLVGLGPKAPTAAMPGPKPAVCILLSPSPSDVQQHEYSYFLFKTNLEFSLSKGLLITEKRLRRELIDRPTWPLLKNKLAIGGAADKGRRRRLAIYELLGGRLSSLLPTQQKHLSDIRGRPNACV